MARRARRSIVVLVQAGMLAAMLAVPAGVRAADATTITTLVSNLNPSLRGESVTFTATVRLEDGTTPVTVGTVRFGRGSGCGAGFTQLQAARAVNTDGVVTFSNADIFFGTTTIWGCYDGVAGQTLSSGASVNQTVVAALPTTLTVHPAGGPFGGTADLSATLVISGRGTPVGGAGVSFSLNGGPAIASTTNASGVATVTGASLEGIASGTYDAGVAASFAGSSTRLASSGTAALTVGPAHEDRLPTTTTVSCGSGPFSYTGDAITPCSVTVTASDGLSLTPDPDYAGNVAAGTATASYTYGGDATHEGSSGSATFTIDPADAACDVSGFEGRYDGAAHGATGTCTGVAGEDLSAGLDLGASFTDAPGGTAAWSFAADNYRPQSGGVGIHIGRAPSAVTVRCPDQVTYTGLPQTPCSASVSGAGGLDRPLDVDYAGNVLGTATATATFTGDANHDGDAASATFLVAYAWSGFLQPINDTGHEGAGAESRFHAGQTIPAKFVLADAFGTVVTQDGDPVFSRSAIGGSCDTTTVPEPVADVDPSEGTAFTWSGDHYQFNWSTRGLAPGEYRISAGLADGTQRSVDICLTR
jgi:hypothetical protein